MEHFKIFQNKNKLPFKEIIKNTLRLKNKEKGNLSLTKYDIIKNDNKIKPKGFNQNNKFTDISDKLFFKSFNKDNAIEELIKNNNTKKSYSIKLKQNNTDKNANSNSNNSLNFHIYNFTLKNTHQDKQNKNNQTIEVNTSSELKNVRFKKNNLFLSFNNYNNIIKDNEQKKYFRTLENYSKESLNLNHNSNYINNIINININFDKKRKKYKNFLSSSLKETINYFTNNIFQNGLNNRDKNLKSLFKFKKNNSNNISSSMKSIKNNKKNLEIQYNHTISNEMQNNDRVRSKNTFLKLLLKAKKQKRKGNNFISFGKILSANKNKRIYNFNENNLKTMKNNILLKVKKNNNIHKLLLLNNINPIIKQDNNVQKSKKKKNYFIQKKSNEYNKIKYYNPSKDNINNKFINHIHSPKETEIKLFLQNKVKKDNIYINNKPELVKEYNHEILLNLLIDEYIFHKNNKLILNSDIIKNYGLNPVLRSYFIDSLLGLQETFLFHNKTLFITLQIFDNYITKIISNKTKVKEANLDLIFTACFLIASKSEESFIYHIKDYLSIISDNYTANDLMTMEYNILKLFDFRAFIPNVLDFFEFFSVMYNLDENMHKKGVIILLIIISDLHLSLLKSSFLAFSVICFLFGNNINYKDIFNKLDCIFDNLNSTINNIDKNDIYNKFVMLLKHLKNEDEIKKTVEKINKYIKHFKSGEFKNVEKKVKEIIFEF